MSGFGVFIMLIYIAFAIISIILIVKIWKMTNDVREIKQSIIISKQYSSDDDSHGYIDKYYRSLMLGDKDAAFEALKARIVERFDTSINNMLSSTLPAFTEDGTMLTKFQRNTFITNTKAAFADYVESSKATGHELPPHLQTPEAFFNFYCNIHGYKVKES